MEKKGNLYWNFVWGSELSEHWTEKFYVECGDLFRKYWETADAPNAGVAALLKIFSNHGLCSGGKVLDLCCGAGAHAVSLAERGYKVVGVDLSPVMIRSAEDLAKRRGVEDRVSFMVGDVRRLAEILNKDEKFHAAINMRTSFGYYDDETDEKLLRDVRELIFPGGVIIIDTTNRDWAIRNLEDLGKPKVTRIGNLEIHERRRFNLDTSRMEIWYKYLDKGESEHICTIKCEIRYYSLHELIHLLERTGWIYVAAYGDYDLNPLTIKKHQAIVVGKKEEHCEIRFMKIEDYAQA